MKSLDQLIEEQLNLPPVLPEVREQLGRIPGVLGVGVGFRVTGGETTDDIVFRVYVRNKRPLAGVPADERIPPVVAGVRTDVTTPFGGSDIQITKVAPNAGEEVSTLIGGVAIAYRGSPAEGTLGCFARLRSDASVTVVLTNHHTVYRLDRPMDTGPGELVGQPGISCCWCCKTGVIGRVLDGARGGLVDCAMVRLNGKRPTVQRLPGIGPDANQRNHDLITGVPTPVVIAGLPSGVFVGEPVRKVGRSSGPTLGRVHQIHAPLDNPHVNYVDQIVIHPLQGGEEPGDGRLNFGVDGDSGAVVVNRFNQVIGLLHKAHDFTGQPENQPEWRNWGAACHIHHVLNRLKIDIFSSPGANLTGIPSTPVEPPPIPAGALLPGSGLVRRTETADDRLAGAAIDEVVETLRASAAGRTVLDLYDTHQEEIRHLVNHDRRVTIAWHRSNGPAFMASLAAALRTGTRTIPREVDGITIEAALERMIDVLAEHGSPALAAAVRRYRGSVSAVLARSTTVTDVLNAIAHDATLARTAGADEAPGTDDTFRTGPTAATEGGDR